AARTPGAAATAAYAVPATRPTRRSGGGRRQGARDARAFRRATQAGARPDRGGRSRDPRHQHHHPVGAVVRARRRDRGRRRRAPDSSRARARRVLAAGVRALDAQRAEPPRQASPAGDPLALRRCRRGRARGGRRAAVVATLTETRARALTSPPPPPPPPRCPRGPPRTPPPRRAPAHPS